jgi:tetratricopeptide (TPR) repeat protein
MLVLLFILLLAAALTNLLIMQGHIIWSVIAAAIALVMLIFNLFAGRKIPRRLLRLISAVGLTVILLIGLWSGLQPKTGGFIAYDAKIASVERLLANERAENAHNNLDQLIAEYGPNDRLLLFKVQASLAEADFASAKTRLYTVSDNTSAEYYALLGQIHALSGQSSDAQRILTLAASQYPQWCEMQLYAGIQAVNNKAYATGEYFLLRAFEQDPELAVALYYLGVTRYEQGLYDESSDFFAEALSIGVDAKIASYISWYEQQMGDDQP